MLFGERPEVLRNRFIDIGLDNLISRLFSKETSDGHALNNIITNKDDKNMNID